MEGETFIISSVSRAVEWTEVFSRSTGSSAEEAAAVLANVCGFTHWESMISAIQSSRPSTCDEQLGKKAVKKRHLEYRGRLVSIHAMDPSYAKYVISHLSPSSGKHFRQFSIDTEKMHGPSDPDSFNINEFLEVSGMDDPEEFERTMKEMLGDIMPDGFDMTGIQDRLRLSGGTDAASWFNILSGLGWNPIDDNSYQENAEFGEPSMVLNDKVHGLVPVYLCAANRTPFDHEDEAANSAMKASLENFQSCGAYGDTAYLLWKSPLQKTINGRKYCHLGMLLFGGSWKEILVNSDCNSLARAYELNEAIDSVDSEPLGLVDDHEAVFMGIHRHLAGMDDPDAPKKGWKIMTAGSPSGWCSIILHHEGS